MIENDPLSFLDVEEESLDPLSFLDEPQEKKIGKKSRLAAQYGIGLTERVAAPYDIAVSPLSSKKAQQVPYRENLFSDIERLQEQKQMGQWDEKDQSLYDSLIEQINNPKEAEKFVKTADISSSGLIEKGAKQLGYNLEPEDLGELGARIAGNLFTPKGFAKGVKQAGNLLNKEARRASKIQSQWKSIERIAKGNPEKENILNFAKSKNLNPQETNILLQSHGRIEFLEKFAKKSKNYKEVAKGLNQKLGNGYEELKDLGRSSGNLTTSEADTLGNDLSKILEDIGETFIEGPDTKGARLAIEEGLFKLENQGGTIADLINSRQNLGQIADWRKVDPKGALLQKAENFFFKAIERKNPEIAKELKKTDTAWSKYKKFSKSLDKKQPSFRWHGIELPGLMGNIAFWGALKLAGISTLGAGKALLAKEIIQRIGDKLLTDPKYHAIRKHIKNAVMSGETEKQRSLFLVLKQMLKKDDPDLYEEISDMSFE